MRAGATGVPHRRLSVAGHLVAVDGLGHEVGDDSPTRRSVVLVDHRRAHAAVPAPGHDLLGGRTGLGDEGQARVPQVVEVHAREPDRGACPSPGGGEVLLAELGPVGSTEQRRGGQRRTGLDQVFAQDLDGGLGQVDGATARGLRGRCAGARCRP